MNAKVFSAQNGAELERQMEAWLAQQPALKVEGIAQSATEDWVIVTMLYSEESTPARGMGFAPR